MFCNEIINLKQSMMKYNLTLLSSSSLFRFNCRNVRLSVIDFNIISDLKLYYIFSLLLLSTILIRICVKVEFIVDFSKKSLNNSEKGTQLN